MSNNRGDTIVEVLIALAILSLAMSITYATVNSSISGLAIARSTSKATARMQQQAELLRIADITNVQKYNFCIVSSDPPIVKKPVNPLSPPIECKVDNIAVTIKQRPDVTGIYDITAKWSMGGKEYSSSMVYEL